MSVKDTAEGIIAKGVGGFYYVDTGPSIAECRARGRFRREGITPLAGDRVRISLQPDGSGRIDEILDRKNAFVRPPVANIDLMVIVASAAIPKTDPFLIDKMTCIAGCKGIEAVVCLNKSDLKLDGELAGIYELAGYAVAVTSAKTGEGIDKLSQIAAGKVCVFTGNSGVGKSSILNIICPGIDLEEGEVSLKLGRGRHTTRHVEFFKAPNGAVIADTPGFASFEVPDLEMATGDALADSFPDFAPYLGRCRFVGCTHQTDEGCAITGAVKDGKISESRYRSYLRLRHEAELQKTNKYR